jgi:hypothetical protein
MLGKWISPRVTIAAAVSVILAEIILPHLAPGRFPSASAMSQPKAVAYFAGALLCLEIARDYDHRLMRLSWLLFSVEGIMLGLHFSYPVQLFIALAEIHIGLLGLLAGMTLTWWQLRRFGLGFHSHRSDYGVIGLIAVAMLTFFGLSYGRGWMVPMLASARTLLFLSAIMAVLLNRFCQQMGGGEIARVIRLFILYVGIRCAMNVVFAVNKMYAPLLNEPYRLLDAVYPWVYLFAASVRAQVIVKMVGQRKNLGALVSPGTP